MARINIDDETRNDPRFVILSKRLQTSKFDARGRMEELWAYCTEKQTYYLSAEIVDVLAERENFSELICDDQVGLGEKTEHGIRIKGTKGRIEWIKKLRQNGKSGGRPRKPEANQTETKQKPDGNQTETKREPDANPLVLALAPALSPVSNTKTSSNFFESFWKIYPRKRKKTDAKIRFKEVVKPEEYFELEQAIKKYTEGIRREKTEQRYILHFASFLGTRKEPKWRDWLDESNGTTDPAGAPAFSFADSTQEAVHDA